MKVPSGGAVAAAAPGAAAAGGAAAEAPKEEAKKEEEKVSKFHVLPPYPVLTDIAGGVRRRHGLRSIRLSAIDCTSCTSHFMTLIVVRLYEYNIVLNNPYATSAIFEQFEREAYSLV